MTFVEMFTVEQVGEALVRARGNKKAAAWKLRCDETTVHGYCRRHPELYEVSRLAKLPRVVERAEDQLVRLVLGGQWKAIRFVLATLGKDRGYTKRRSRFGFASGARPVYVQRERKRIETARATLAEVNEPNEAGNAAETQAALTGRKRAAKGHKRAGRPYLFTPEEVANALVRSHGIKRHAARLLGCGTTTIYLYCARYPEIAEACDLEREVLVDYAEAQVTNLVDEGYWPAVKFVLETLGKDRGYDGERRTHDGVEEGDELRELVREMYGQKGKAGGNDK